MKVVSCASGISPSRTRCDVLFAVAVSSCTESELPNGLFARYNNKFLDTLGFGSVDTFVVICLARKRSASALGACDDSAMTRPPPSVAALVVSAFTEPDS